jgi:xyloglucan fucosyltransferase
MLSSCNVKGFIKTYFPTREMFAPLSQFLLQVAPQQMEKVRQFQINNFGAYTIGLQIRRLKCDNSHVIDPSLEELHCKSLPSIEAYCDVAKTIQVTHGISDEDVRFFVAADEEATYDEVRSLKCIKWHLHRRC